MSCPRKRETSRNCAAACSTGHAEITIAGSLPEMLRTIRAANDADPHRAVSVPSLLVGGLTVGA
jgi:predicted Zn-dependent protease